MSVGWNLWHGCHKISPGCKHCYVYRQDAKHDKDSSQVVKTGNFRLPVKRGRDKQYKIPSGELVYTCFTSDFFVEDADEWRIDAWLIMRLRSDLKFFLITKRIDRFYASLPDDWGEGYDNVTICCTIENQDRADYRLPLFLKAPIKHKQIVCEPLLECIQLEKYLNSSIEQVTVGGESGNEAREMNYDWVLNIRQQCIRQNVNFHFHQTGARLRKDGKLYQIRRSFQHSQARKAGIDFSSSHLTQN